MEKEAYERARTYDTETIRRQDAEIDELREENKTLRQELQRVAEEAQQSKREAAELREEVRALTRRVSLMDSPRSARSPIDMEQEGTV